MILQLKDIKNNPFRDLKRNPLNPEKVAELVASINETGFWSTVVVRKNSKGEYEMAFGHHRLEAAKQAGLTEHDFFVEPMSDAMMMKRMARENSEVYGYTILSALENVRGVINGLAGGLLTSAIVTREESETLKEAFAKGKKTKYDLWVSKDVPSKAVIYAPSFIPAGERPSESLGGSPYTAAAVAIFLGKFSKGKATVKADDSIQAALGALHLIELGVITESSVKGMTTEKLLEMVRGVKKRLSDGEEKRKQAQLDAKQLQERQAKLDAERREREAKDAATERKRLQELAEAKLEKDKEQIKALEEQRKKHREQAEARALVFKENRAKLDEKIEAAQERAEAFKPKPEETLRAQAVGAMKFKFDSIYSDASGLLKESEILGRNQKLTPNERELLRQSMLKAGERLRYGAENFLPVGTPRLATKALREKEAKANAKVFFKKTETKSKGEK